MEPLSDEYLASCPVENGFRMRGTQMTRIEVFVDAAFAFAITMLVISFDRIPETFLEIVAALKGIPAFVVAVVQLVWIWHEHSQWSERYGMRDAGTVVLSTSLLIVMLIYIYPMRIMFEGMFEHFSFGFLSSNFTFTSVSDVRWMFVFLGAGLAAICLVFWMMYRHALKRTDLLRLSAAEAYLTQTTAFVWLGSALVCLVPVLLGLTLPQDLLAFSGSGFALLAIWIPWAFSHRARHAPAAS